MNTVRKEATEIDVHERPFMVRQKNATEHDVLSGLPWGED
jgi:hypothetical protein